MKDERDKTEQDGVDDIKVGDEVTRIVNYRTGKTIRCVVVELCQDELFRVLDSRGLAPILGREDIRKTGRRFPQMVDILQQLQEDSE